MLCAVKKRFKQGDVATVTRGEAGTDMLATEVVLGDSIWVPGKPFGSLAVTYTLVEEVDLDREGD